MYCVSLEVGAAVHKWPANKEKTQLAEPKQEQKVQKLTGSSVDWMPGVALAGGGGRGQELGSLSNQIT